MTTRIAFVCVQNAGRSQMATAFAEAMVAERDLDVEIVTGGTRPAEHVHEAVVDAMRGVGIDVSDRTPREITPGELADCDYAITMGCSAEDVCPATWGGESRDWDLDDPDGRPFDEVRAIRDEVERRVRDLLDEVAVEGDAGSA